VANFVFNRSKGRVTEFAERVNANDPVNSVFLIALIATTGVETDAVLMDKDDFAALVSGTTDFATNTGGGRKTLDQAGGITVTYDDTNDRVDVDVPDQTWTGLANDGTGAIGDVVFGYDSDSTAGTDANVLPMTFHDFVITPDGSDVTAVIATGGFFRAS
jgi:hypothetical protein